MKERLAAPKTGSPAPRAAGSATAPRLASVIGNRAMAAAAAGTTAPIRPLLSPAGVQLELSSGRAPGGARSHPARSDSAQVHAIAARGTTTPATRLPYADQIQRAFGQHDISGIQAHTGHEAAASAREMGARAYATGDHVVLDRGTDLHTVAHEAAHVIQQRVGVNLSGGVGRAGDPHEQHADTVADMVVQGRSAESHLEQYAGGSQAGGAVVQRASDYTGILPRHETFGDSYRFKGERSTNFTYHHIIPENKLEEVYEQLEIIRKYLNDSGSSNETSKRFDTELSGLLTDARKGWLKTRAKNTTYALKREFKYTHLQIRESEMEKILAKFERNLDVAHSNVHSHLNERVASDFGTAKREARYAVPRVLKTTRFRRDGRDRDAWGDAWALEQMSKQLDPALYNVETLESWMKDALQAARDEDQQNGITGEWLDKRSVMKHLRRAFETYELATYLGDKFPALSSSPESLEKLLKENALAHEAHEHLEHAVQWNPGNIHRGPASSNRLNPKSGKQFDELVDDGGERFEKAAANLVTTEHYEVLEELNKQIDEFLKDPLEEGDTPDGNKIEAAVEIVTWMRDLMRFGLTEFDESQWEQKGDKHMRLKKDEAKLHDAGLIR